MIVVFAGVGANRWQEIDRQENQKPNRCTHSGIIANKQAIRLVQKVAAGGIPPPAAKCARYESQQTRALRTSSIPGLFRYWRGRFTSEGAHGGKFILRRDPCGLQSFARRLHGFCRVGQVGNVLWKSHRNHLLCHQRMLRFTSARKFPAAVQAPQPYTSPFLALRFAVRRSSTVRRNATLAGSLRQWSRVAP